MKKFFKWFTFSLAFMTCIFAVTWAVIAIFIKIIDVLYAHGLPIWQQYLIFMGSIEVIASLIYGIYRVFSDRKKEK